LQALPVGGNVRTEILGEPDIVRQAQRIADHDVGGGEPARAERFGLTGSSLHRT
jgi:hypothetical protein